MKNIHKLKILFLATVILGCSSEDDIVDEWVEANTPEPLSAGTLDLTKYVSVGNSITAGFYDGALFPEGQANSYPSILADQLTLVGGGTFNNPDIISGSTGTGRISLDIEAALAFLNAGEGSLADALITGAANPLSPSSVSINNFGVPGARSIDIVTNGYGAANPLYGAFQSSASASVVGDAAAAGGSFFSLWIGSNDVLGYARDGGTNDVFVPTDPTTITDGPINPAAPSAPTFSAAIGATLDALSSGGASGVILTIPPITTIPYFQAATTLGGGVELVPLTEEAQVAQLNGAFNLPIPTALQAGMNPGYNALLAEAVAEGSLTQAEADRRTVSWQVGANAPFITDESLTSVTVDISEYAGQPAGTILVPLPLYRQAAAANPLAGLGDLFPLPALFSLGDVLSPTAIVGVTVPLDDELTLTETEQINIITAVATFNGVIRAQAAARPNINLVDLDPLFADINGLGVAQATALGMSAAGINAADGIVGRVVNGINLVPISFEQTTLFNSLYSTDFIHPNPRGAALIANEMIEVINDAYDSEIPTVNPLIYPGINAPF